MEFRSVGAEKQNQSSPVLTKVRVPLKDLPEYGKIGSEFFKRVIYPNLGRKNSRVLIGPKTGVDTCAISLGRDRVLAATTDPISFIPDLGPEGSAWESVNLIASDLSTSGLAPQFALFDLNLPPHMKKSDFERYWVATSKECSKLGITIIGGHTSRFEGLNSTVIGAGSMFSVGPKESYHSASDGRVGDLVLVTKGAAIATTAILATAFQKTVSRKLGQKRSDVARKYLKKTTVVKEALTAARAGANAMHDATEGGVLSAAYELANASGTGLELDLSEIPVSEETREICEIFKIDPYVSLSEGTLVLSCVPLKAKKVISALHSARIKVAVVGELVQRRNGLIVMKDGRRVPIKYPMPDPYWRAYYDGKSRGLQ